MGIRPVHILLGFALLYLLISGFEESHLLSGTVGISLSSNEVRPGDTITITVSVSGVGYEGFLCVDSSSVGTGYGDCHSDDGRCVKPCWPFDFYDVLLQPADYYQGFQFFGGGSGGGYIESSDTAVYRVMDNQSSSSGVDFALFPSSYNGTGYGFVIESGETIRIAGRLQTTDGSLLYNGVVVGVCYETGYGTPTIEQTYTGWSYWRTTSGSWWGKSWNCELYKATTNSYSNYFDLKITAPSSNISIAYVTASSMCFYDPSYCRPSGYSNVEFTVTYAEVVNPRSIIFQYEADSSLQNTLGCVWDSPAPSQETFTTTVSSSASPGSHVVEGSAFSFSLLRLFSSPTKAIYHYCGLTSSSPVFIDSDEASYTVEVPASDVQLYAYGSNSGSPSQEPDDHYLQGRIYVSGGTLFDSVKLYLDGTLIATYTSNQFSCGSSSCYKDFTYSMQGRSDGSHEVKAELIVDGSLKDTDQETFNYYQVGVRGVSASQAGNDNVSVSFEYKGGHESYQIYIDTSSCVVASNDDFRPSASHNWQSYGPQSFVIPDCAKESGSHTLYVKLCDESGLCSTDSTTVNFSFTYNYSVSIDQPVAGIKHLSTDQRGAPPSDYSEPFSISYSTDDPSATLKLVVGGSEVQSWTVTGSGTKTGSVPSNYLACGDTAFTADLSGSSGSDQSSVTVTYICWYSSIESPTGTVQVPSSDNVTVNEGTTLTLLGIADETPEQFSKVVDAYLDGTLLSPVSCPSGYTDCFAVPVGGLTCGSTHTLKLDVGDGSTVYASDTESITLQCVQRYVDIVSPSDGAVFDFNVPLSDANIDVFVNYAGGDALSFKLNGQDVNLLDYNGTCSYGACYVLPGTELNIGDNNLEAVLESNGAPVASDSVLFTVNLWQFIVGEDWTSTPPLLYVEEHGTHPDVCYVFHDENLETMVYDDDSSRWLLPIGEEYVGRTVEVFCSQESRIVFDKNYAVVGPGTQPASPVVSGGGGGVVKVVPRVAFPVFPDRRQAAHYIYTVYHFSGVKPGDNLKDVYISQERLCIVPKESEPFTVEYYKYNFEKFPETDNDVRQILGHLTPDLLVEESGSSVGAAKCYDIKGTGVFVVSFRDGVYDVLVLDVAEAAAGLNLGMITVVLIVLLLIYYMMSRGG